MQEAASRLMDFVFSILILVAMVLVNRFFSGFGAMPLSEIKDDTLPCKRQALAWQKEPKAWTQAFQGLNFFFAIFWSL